MSEKLVNVWRGALVESSHDGDVVVVNVDGKVLWALGNPERVVYARSSAKPLQALPLVETGAANQFGITDEELAVICASHNGEPYHTELVASILEKIGLSAENLLCGIHAPFHTPSYETLLRTGTTPNVLHNNCSGKHAGMLALATYLGADVSSYLQPEHPVQKMMLDSISAICNYPAKEVVLGTDGCGVPVFGLPMRQLALGFARLANPAGLSGTTATALRRIRDAMMTYPRAVAGENRFCTDLMEAGKGQVVGKFGAEAVYGLGIPQQGLGIFIKISDGNTRALYPTVVESLKQLEILPDSALHLLEKYRRPEIRNHQGMLVGRIEPVFQLEKVRTVK